MLKPSSITQLLETSGESTSLFLELEKYRRQLAVMFTDIKGSTSYFERYGDAAGLVMVHQCNKVLMDSVQRHNGKVIKTVGDAVMASFEDCREAVAAAVEIQKELRARNSGKAETHRVCVRIGLNYGPGIVKSNDVFGDVVNVASRVEHIAQPEQIVVSTSVREQVEGSFELRKLGWFSLKGKEGDQDLYEVVWNLDEPQPSLSQTLISGPLIAFTGARPFVLQHLRHDGSPATSLPVRSPGVVIGRTEGDLNVPSDPKLAPAHARFFVQDGRLFIEDISGVGNVYLRLISTYMLQDGDLVRMGSRTLRFRENTHCLQAAAATGVTIADLSALLQAAVAEFVEADVAPGSTAPTYPIREEQVTFGRMRGTYVFSGDPVMSFLHARVYQRGENFFIEDLGSRNGTFVRVRGKAPVPAGSTVIIGEQFFRVTQ